MKTSININDDIYLKAKKYAIDSHKTFARVVEDALRSALSDKKPTNVNPVALLTVKGNGLKHGVDIDNNQSLNDIMG